MNPDFTKIPYGFAEFPQAQPADRQKAAGTTAPWQSAIDSIVEGRSRFGVVFHRVAVRGTAP